MAFVVRGKFLPFCYVDRITCHEDFILNQNNLAGQTCISLKFCVVCESMNEKTSLIEEFQTGGERVCDRLKQEQRG